jgi:hypothetical protein
VRAHGEGVAQLFDQVASREALPAGVDERHVPLGVGHPHQRRRGVGKLTKARLGVAHHLLMPGPLGGRAEHVRDRLQEVRVLGVEALSRAAVCGYDAEMPAPRSNGRGNGADHLEIPLERRGPKRVSDAKSSTTTGPSE